MLNSYMRSIFEYQRQRKWQTGIWWRNIDQEIEKTVADCESCTSTRLILTPLQTRPWDKIGADLLKNGGEW